MKKQEHKRAQKRTSKAELESAWDRIQKNISSTGANLKPKERKVPGTLKKVVMHPLELPERDNKYANIFAAVAAAPIELQKSYPTSLTLQDTLTGYHAYSS